MSVADEVHESTLKQGDLVKVVSGGPPMTVALVTTGPIQVPPGMPPGPSMTMVECVYFDNENRLQVAKVPIQILRRWVDKGRR